MSRRTAETSTLTVHVVPAAPGQPMVVGSKTFANVVDMATKVVFVARWLLLNTRFGADISWAATATVKHPTQAKLPMVTKHLDRFVHIVHLPEICREGYPCSHLGYWATFVLTGLPVPWARSRTLASRTPRFLCRLAVWSNGRDATTLEPRP